MELELGLKLTRAADDFISDFQIAKDRAGPLFLSRETDAVFILTAHLKGYKRENMKIDINEDGTLIAISGERKVKETVMVGWKVYKNDTEIKGFKKAFKIPDEVILDKIRCNFNDEEATLKITMPKKVKGFCGTNIEEIKEKHDDLVKEGSTNLQIVDENANSQITGTSDRENDGNAADKLPSEKKKADVEEKQVEDDQNADDIQETPEHEQDDICDKEENVVEPGKVENEGHNKTRAKGFKMCFPIVAGSTLLLSFVVFVFQIIRSKNQTSRKRD